MPVIPTSRPDNSGGWMNVKYTDGTHTHRARYHLLAFDNSVPDLPYHTGGSTTEADVQATFTALAGFLQPFYNGAWTISLDSVYKNMGPDPNRAGYNLFTELFGYTVPPAVVGSSGTATAATSQPGMIMYNFRTTQGGRARAVLIGSSSWIANAVANPTPNVAGDSGQKLLAYLVGDATGIVGHDGYKFAVAPIHQTSPYNRRLRRRYGLA